MRIKKEKIRELLHEATENKNQMLANANVYEGMIMGYKKMLELLDANEKEEEEKEKN